MRQTDLFSSLSVVQGMFYVGTGVWSLISPRTFQMVTGPKTDYWLVRTVGVLVTVIGSVLALAGLRKQSTREIPLLAAGSAAGLAAIDVVYVARRRISPIYLADAVVEIGLMLAWLFVRRRGRGVSVFSELFRRQDATEAQISMERASRLEAPETSAPINYTSPNAITQPTRPSNEALGI